MKIIKRNGKSENIKFDKILARIKKQTYGFDSKYIEPVEIAQKVISGLYDGVTSKEIDELTAETAASMTIKHPDYSVLASRVAITSLYKEVNKSFTNTITLLYNYIDPKTNLSAGLINDEVYKFIMDNADELNSVIITDRDFLIDYFGFKTLERAYLLKINGKVVETPQFMWMRVACGIWYGNIDEVIKTYDLMSNKYFTHATPTLFNAGTKRPQNSSCFLLGMKEDSIKGIYDTLGDVAQISKNAGGIGLHVHNVRASGAYIKGTNGTSNGLIPMLRVFNETARYVDQGGGRRKGSFAIYLEPWHSDVYDFLDLRKNHGKEEMRARDLFTALWIPDLFMECVNDDGDWYLFSPDEAPGLSDVVGDNFVVLYNKYVEEGKFRKKIKARDLWDKIVDSQMETGTPYMLAKDAANLKSNQQNLGVIKSSNLCVAPETQILTLSGYQTISELEGETVEVWNGKEWSETKVVKTGENQKLIDVSVKYYSFDIDDNIINTDIVLISATEYHKWYDTNGNELKTIELYSGLELEKSLLPKGGYRKFEIIRIEDNNRYDDTYCVNEPKEHKVMFNGVLTGNCTEIIEYSDDKEQAVCNLASLALPMYINKTVTDMDYNLLYDVTYQVTVNLNRVIDVNYYPTEGTRLSNMRHRPIGLGVQGLADVYAKLGLPFDSDTARDINKKIFETIYFASMTASKDLAIKNGAYETFKGSPLSEGKFQFDMWTDNTISNIKTDDGKSKTVISESKPIVLSGMWDWDSLRKEVLEHGVYNSLLFAPMPTASCQVVNTEIVTNEGIMSFSEIMDESNIDWKEIEKTNHQHWVKLTNKVSVKTMNGFVETDKIYYNGHKEVFAIEMEDGIVFEATENHRFLVNRGVERIWVRVDELIEGDDIVELKE